MKTYNEMMTGNGIDSYANFIGDTEDIKNFYVLLSHSRDSGILQESNFNEAVKLLGGESDKVQIHRFGHWGCGWFELILLHPDMKERGEEIEASLEQYAVLNDEDLYSRESEEVQSLWGKEVNRERIEYCTEANISIFAARESTPPEEVYQRLSDSIQY